MQTVLYKSHSQHKNTIIKNKNDGLKNQQIIQTTVQVNLNRPIKWSWREHLKMIRVP